MKIDIPTVLVHLRGRVVREAKSRLGARAARRWTRSRACSARGAATSARSGWRGSATGRWPACRARCPAGPRCASCPAPSELPRVVGRARRRRRGRHRPRGHHRRVAREPRRRDEILGRIRSALGAGAAVPDVPRDYRRPGSGPPAGRPGGRRPLLRARGRVPRDGPPRRRRPASRTPCWRPARRARRDRAARGPAGRAADVPGLELRARRPAALAAASSTASTAC